MDVVWGQEIDTMDIAVRAGKRDALQVGTERPELL